MRQLCILNIEFGQALIVKWRPATVPASQKTLVPNRKPDNREETVSRGKIAPERCVHPFCPANIALAGISGPVFCRPNNEHTRRQNLTTEKCYKGENEVR